MEELFGRDKNSLVFRKPEEPYGDISILGIIEKNKDYSTETFDRKWHDEFKLYDIVYYNVQNKEYELAIARNTKQSEAAGMIVGITGSEFTVRFSGYTEYLGFGEQTQLSLPPMTPIWLSDTVFGGMTLTKPERVAKVVGYLFKNMVLIKPGPGQYMQPDNPSWDVAVPYTRQELDDIISKTWWRERHG